MGYDRRVHGLRRDMHHPFCAALLIMANFHGGNNKNNNYDGPL
jgi:hypothetical protein